LRARIDTWRRRRRRNEQVGHTKVTTIQVITGASWAAVSLALSTGLWGLLGLLIRDLLSVRALLGLRLLKWLLWLLVPRLLLLTLRTLFQCCETVLQVSESDLDRCYVDAPLTISLLRDVQCASSRRSGPFEELGVERRERRHRREQRLRASGDLAAERFAETLREFRRDSPVVEADAARDRDAHEKAHQEIGGIRRVIAVRAVVAHQCFQRAQGLSSGAVLELVAEFLHAGLATTSCPVVGEPFPQKRYFVAFVLPWVDGSKALTFDSIGDRITLRGCIALERDLYFSQRTILEGEILHARSEGVLTHQVEMSAWDVQCRAQLAQD
jgi:hypothetical protein